MEEHRISKSYFIYYHGKKYFFAEGNIKSKTNTGKILRCMAVNKKIVIICAINENLTNREKQKIRHILLKNEQLRVNTKITIVRW